MVAGRPHTTASEYLEWEQHQDLRHEYIGGEIVAMTGASMAHNMIAVNLSAELRTALRSGPCRVFGSDMKLQITPSGPFFYPDISVTCDGQEPLLGHTVSFPRLVVEILLPSTEAFDRGAKFRHYRRLAALQEYVLIDSQETAVEFYRRSTDNQQLWEFESYGSGATVHFESLGLDLPIASLYEKVTFFPSPSTPA